MIPLVATFRMRLLPWSPIYKLPTASTARPSGRASCALVAGPPSPEYPSEPFPATVVMMPFVATFRILFPPGSTMYKLLVASTATPDGPARESATVVMMPLVATLRMRPLDESEIYKVPPASKATPRGVSSWALVAVPPSPENPGRPFPATRARMPRESIL